MVIESGNSVLQQAGNKQFCSKAFPASEPIRDSILRVFYELLTTLVTSRSLSAWKWHWNNAKDRCIIPFFSEKIKKRSSLFNLETNKLMELKQQFANIAFSGNEKQRFECLQKELDQERKRGNCYGASVNLLTHELQNQNLSCNSSVFLYDVTKSKERTAFFEEVELLRAKIEEALYLNQNHEEMFEELKGMLQLQKELLPGFTTVGEADKGDYLNFDGICQALQFGTAQEAFIIHGDSGKRSHAIAIIQNTRTRRFYLYDLAGFPISNGSMYAFDSAVKLQKAVISYISSHYPDLSESQSRWRLQQIELCNQF